MKTAESTSEQTRQDESVQTAHRLSLEKSLAADSKGAEHGNEDALWAMALRYARGIGVEKNAVKALEYLNLMSKEERYQEMLRAELYAEEGRIEIARDLFYIHYNLYNDCYALSEFFKTFTVRGEKIPPNYLEEAVDYCEKRDTRQLLHTAELLIEEDYAEGYYIKAVVLYNNDYEFEREKAAYVLSLLETAAEKGYRRGLKLLCAIAAKSQICEQEKFKLYKRAAEAGEADGAFFYAQLFENQNAYPQSPAETSQIRLTKSEPPPHLRFAAAEQGGSTRALYRLALDLRKSGVKRQPQKYFQTLKAVAESKRLEFAFTPVAARYLIAEAYQYGIGTQKDLDEADVWYETVYEAPQPFMNWLKDQNDKQKKIILRNLLAHEKRYRLYSRARPVSLPQWLKRFDKKLWRQYVADDSRFRRGQAYIEEAEKYPDMVMPHKKATALRRAMRLGNGKACDVIEKYYALNNGTESRGRIKNLKKGVALRNPCSMFYLGHAFIKSGDCKRKVDGVRLTRSAANRGIDLSAIKNLSLLYKNGTGVEKNPEKYLELMLACFDEKNAGHFVDSEKLLNEFCDSIGYAFYTGKGTEKNVRKAALWFRKGADRGYANCMRNLGWLHFDDEDGRESDALSRRWLEKAAAKDRALEDNTYHNLGYFYQYGAEGGQDLLKAIQYYRMTYRLFVSKKDLPKSAIKAANAAYNLGVLYSQQLSDYENAIVWYKKALASNEDLSTLNNLAGCYTNTDKPDFEAAETLYKRILETAPEHSYAIGYAYSNLADLAVDTRLKTPDYEKARALKKRAIEELETTVRLHENGADIDFSDSVYYNLAHIYLNSVLIERDADKGRAYAVKGAKLGHYQAVTMCKKNGFTY